MSNFRNCLLGLLFVASASYASVPFEFKGETACYNCCYADLEYGKGSVKLAIMHTEQKLDLHVSIACFTKGRGFGKTIQVSYQIHNGVILSADGSKMGELNEHGVILRLHAAKYAGDSNEGLQFLKYPAGGFHLGYYFRNGNPASERNFRAPFSTLD